MRQTESKLAFIAVCIVSAALAHAQVPYFTKINYEAGIPYDGIVGKSFSPCDADDFGLRIRWGDAIGSWSPPNVSELPPPETINPPPVKCGVGYCVKGWHTFTTRHIFTDAGDFTAQVINEHLHCYGSFDHPDFPGAPTVVHVFPRVPLSRVVANQQLPAKPGQIVTLTISLQRSPPASGTRVFLIVDKPELLDTQSPLPQYVDFAPAGSTDQTMTIHLAPDIKTVATLTLTAQAGGPAISVPISIKP